jgi:Zn-finger nucleic acid-binding protein
MRETNMDVYNLSHCPKCGVRWQDELNIYQRLFKLREDGNKYYASRTDEQIRESAHSYGWYAKGEEGIGSAETEDIRYTELLGIEIPEKYDGISYWQCKSCKATWDRFTGEEQHA